MFKSLNIIAKEEYMELFFSILTEIFRGTFAFLIEYPLIPTFFLSLLGLSLTKDPQSDQ